MANSSDWLAELAGEDSFSPQWIAALEEPAIFRDHSPFAKEVWREQPEAPDQSASAVQEDKAATEAIENAFARGEAAGRAAVEAEMQIDAKRHTTLRLAFRALDEAARDALAADLAETVVYLCEGVIGQCAVDGTALLQRCQVAAERMGTAAQLFALHLHPEDIEIVGEEALSCWRVISDPSLERGAIVLEGPEGTVRDGPGEWRRAIAAAVRG